MFRTVRTLTLAALCSVAVLSACSAQATVSRTDLEQGVSDALQRSVGQRPDSVDCPGSVKATVGQTARCTLSSGSTRYGLTVTITSYSNGKAAYNVQVDNQPMSG
jgi:hypothetical protein